MARFIDADKIITDAVKKKKFFIEYDDVFNSQKVVKTIYGDLADFINSQPTADVVEVVRCKDCRNRYEKNWSKCTGRRPDDFCSDGKRKEGAE